MDEVTLMDYKRANIFYVVEKLFIIHYNFTNNAHVIFFKFTT